MYFAHKHKRSVRWSATRSDDFLTIMAGRDQVAFVEGAFRRDGTLLAMRSRNLGNLGAYLYGVTTMIPTGGPRMMTGAYDVKVARGTAVGLFTASRADRSVSRRRPTRGGADRRAGHGRRRARAGHRSARDPQAQLHSARRLPVHDAASATSTTRATTRDARACARAGRLPGARRAARRQARAQGRVFGIGVCTFVEPAGGAGSRAAACVSNRTARSSSSPARCRTARATTPRLRRSWPTSFKVAPEQVTVVQGDSRRVPPGSRHLRQPQHDPRWRRGQDRRDKVSTR